MGRGLPLGIWPFRCLRSQKFPEVSPDFFKNLFLFFSFLIIICVYVQVYVTCLGTHGGQRGCKIP